MNALDDSRLGFASASEADRIFACDGYLWLKKQVEAQAVQVDHESAASRHGDLIHEANELSDTTDLKYSEEEQVKVVREREQLLTEQWAADFEIPMDKLTIIREQRYWYSDRISAKLDTLVICGEHGLLIDAKAGRKAIPVPVKSWQLRVGAIAAAANLALSSVRVGIANVWGNIQAPCQYDSEDLNRISQILMARLKEVSQPGLPFTVSSACEYCVCRHVCPAQREQMQVAIQHRTINWSLITPEQKRPLWIAADMAEKAGKAIKDQLKADLAAGEEIPGLSKRPDGTTRKITNGLEAFNALWDTGKFDQDDLHVEFLKKSTISLENFTTLYRDTTGASKEEAEAFLAKCSDFITTNPRSGSIVVEKD